MIWVLVGVIVALFALACWLLGNEVSEPDLWRSGPDSRRWWQA